MKRFYSKATGTTYLEGVHAEIPEDAVVINEEFFLSVIANPAPNKIRSHDANGLPILIDPPPRIPTEEELCADIDYTADTARALVVGDPLRAEEYKTAREEAQAFAADGYQGDVPRAVAAWAINGRTAQQAADEILAEAAAWTEALYFIRETRLAAKEQVRDLMAAEQPEQAQAAAEQAIAAINAAIAGVGNAAN